MIERLDKFIDQLSPTIYNEILSNYNIMTISGKESGTTVSSSAWLSLAIVSGLALVTMYGETMVLPAIPDFIKDFGITYNISSWILSSYLIAGAVMTPIAGKLSDVYGKKRSC